MLQKRAFENQSVYQHFVVVVKEFEDTVFVDELVTLGGQDEDLGNHLAKTNQKSDKIQPDMNISESMKEKKRQKTF